MPVINIPLRNTDANDSGFDPFGEDGLRIRARCLVLDLLYEDICFPGIGEKGVMASIKTGRPNDSFVEGSLVIEMYKTAEAALQAVAREFRKSSTEGGFGLDRSELARLKSGLETIVRAKSQYFENQDVPERSQEIDFHSSKHFEYLGTCGNGHIYQSLPENQENITLTVKVIPTIRSDVFQLESTAFLSGANQPFYSSTRFVDLRYLGLEGELGREENVLRYVTDNALSTRKHIQKKQE